MELDLPPDDDGMPVSVLLAAFTTVKDMCCLNRAILKRPRGKGTETCQGNNLVKKVAKVTASNRNFALCTRKVSNKHPKPTDRQHESRQNEQLNKERRHTSNT